MFGDAVATLILDRPLQSLLRHIHPLDVKSRQSAVGSNLRPFRNTPPAGRFRAQPADPPELHEFGLGVVSATAGLIFSFTVTVR
ncbi:MAG TPA: hypothetical protein VNS34_08410 [Rhizobiaceae bacterium]|nr:hypothetical protein [Rhizobiaceae bacterium]